MIGMASSIIGMMVPSLKHYLERGQHSPFWLS